MVHVLRFSSAVRRLALLSVCALALIACARGGDPSTAAASASDFPRAGEPAAEEQACSRDIECALVEDCCGCARGGLRMGVRNDKLQGLTERSASVCEERTCGEQPSEHKSCSANAARCLGGRCIPAL